MPKKVLKCHSVSAFVLTHLSVRKAEQKLPVEASGPSESGIYGVQPVGGSDYDHLTTTVQSIH